MKGILYFDVGPAERVGLFMQMADIDMKGCDIVINGIEHLPTTYRKMIHG